MHRNWPYSININGAEEEMGEDLGVMPIPYGVTADEAKYPMTGGPVAALGGWHLTMNPNSEKKSAAAQVLQTIQSEEFMLDLFEIVGLLPPRPELFNSDAAKQVPVMGRYMETLKVAGENAIPRPVTVAWPQESGKIAKEVNNAMGAKKTPEAAMSDLKEQLESIENSV
jgi:ABC-type glycerol-3-phosphate transport system substrate-binding protein